MHTKIGANIFEAVGRENVFINFGVHITLYAHLRPPLRNRPKISVQTLIGVGVRKSTYRDSTTSPSIPEIY